MTKNLTQNILPEKIKSQKNILTEKIKSQKKQILKLTNNDLLLVFGQAITSNETQSSTTRKDKFLLLWVGLGVA